MATLATRARNVAECRSLREYSARNECQGANLPPRKPRWAFGFVSPEAVVSADRFVPARYTASDRLTYYMETVKWRRLDR